MAFAGVDTSMPSTAVPTTPSPAPPPLSSSVSLAFILAKLALSSLETLFSLYYVDVFLNSYRLSTRWFNIGQFIYVIWNALNDPLFAYIQDHVSFGSKAQALRNGAILYAISFLLLFFPLGSWLGDGGEVSVGLHFIVTICAFDGVFTWTALAHCALFAEISTNQFERLRVLRQGEISGLLIAPIVWIAGSLFDTTQMYAFRLFVLVLAVVAAATLIISSKYVKTATECAAAAATSSPDNLSTSPVAAVSTRGESSPTTAIANRSLTSHPPLKLFVKQLLSHKNMVLFICVNFLQIFLLAFFNNFFTIILRAFFQQEKEGGSSGYIGLILGVSQLFSPLLLLFLAREVHYNESSPFGIKWPWISHSGTTASAMILPTSAIDRTKDELGSNDRSYRVIGELTWVKVAVSALLLLCFGSALGLEHPALFLTFLLLLRTITTVAFSFFSLTLSELIDEDQTNHWRRHPLSSSYFGWNALFTKPAHSIAPVVVLHVWEQYGFRSSNSNDSNNSADGASTIPVADFDPIMSAANPLLLKSVICMACLALPLVTGFIQLLLWKFAYSLHGSKLVQVKRQLNELQQQIRSTTTSQPTRSPHFVSTVNANDASVDVDEENAESSQSVELTQLLPTMTRSTSSSERRKR